MQAQLRSPQLRPAITCTFKKEFHRKRVICLRESPQADRPDRRIASMPHFVAGELPANQEITVDYSRRRSDACTSAMETVKRMATQNAVVVFSTNNCCMSHVVKGLLCSLGVNPTVVELDDAGEEGRDIEDESMAGVKSKTKGCSINAMEGALRKLAGGCGSSSGSSSLYPVVFIGGKLLGGVDRLLAAHISGSLVPQLKEAGALWL